MDFLQDYIRRIRIIRGPILWGWVTSTCTDAVTSESELARRFNASGTPTRFLREWRCIEELFARRIEHSIAKSKRHRAVWEYGQALTCVRWAARKVLRLEMESAPKVEVLFVPYELRALASLDGSEIFDRVRSFAARYCEPDGEESARWAFCPKREAEGTTKHATTRELRRLLRRRVEYLVQSFEVDRREADHLREMFGGKPWPVAGADQRSPRERKTDERRERIRAIIRAEANMVPSVRTLCELLIEPDGTIPSTRTVNKDLAALGYR